MLRNIIDWHQRRQQIKWVAFPENFTVTEGEFDYDITGMDVDE